MFQPIPPRIKERLQPTPREGVPILIIFSRLRREIFQIFANHSNLFSIFVPLLRQADLALFCPNRAEHGGGMRSEGEAFNNDSRGGSAPEGRFWMQFYVGAE